MLETIGEYAAEQPPPPATKQLVRDAHAAWCLDLALEAAPFWFTLTRQRGPIGWTSSTTTCGQRSLTRQRLGGRRRPPPGRPPLAVLVCPRSPDGGPRVARPGAGLERGTRTVERAWALIGATAMTADRADETTEARGEEARDIAHEIEDTLAGAHALIALGVAAGERGDAAQSTSLTEAALAAFRDLGDAVPSAASSASMMLDNLAYFALGQGDDARALRLAEEALVLQRKVGYSWGMADSILILARVARNQRDAVRSVAHARESLRLACDQPDLLQIVGAFDHLALLAAENGMAERAVSLFAASVRLYELLGVPTEPGRNLDRDRALAALRDRLGVDAFAAAWTAGWALTLEEAVAEAMRVEAAPSDAPPIDPAARHGLTPRELEVLGLLGAGQTDREIAGTLFLSTRTVNTHVANLLAKLDVPTRRDAVIRAREGRIAPEERRAASVYVGAIPPAVTQFLPMRSARGWAHAAFQFQARHPIPSLGGRSLPSGGDAIRRGDPMNDHGSVAAVSRRTALAGLGACGLGLGHCRDRPATFGPKTPLLAHRPSR